MQYTIGDKTAPCLTPFLTGNVLIGYCSNEHLLVAGCSYIINKRRMCIDGSPFLIGFHNSVLCLTWSNALHEYFRAISLKILNGFHC